MAPMYYVLCFSTRMIYDAHVIHTATGTSSCVACHECAPGSVVTANWDYTISEMVPPRPPV